MQKTVTIYDKNGNPMDVRESLKSTYVGNGWFDKKPKTQEKKES